VYEEDWGLKQLAYPIQHKTSGFYYLIEFKADPSFVATLETQYHRDERIIRFITVSLDQHALAYAEHRRQNRASKKAAPAPVKEEAPVAEDIETVVEELNEDISDYYLDKNIEVLNEYFMSIIREYTKNGKLVMGYEEAIAKDFRNVAKAIYDMGLISGVTVAQDPIKLEVFLKNKEKLEDGTY
jgi:restriction endonuclease Mrr